MIQVHPLLFLQQSCSRFIYILIQIINNWAGDSEFPEKNVSFSGDEGRKGMILPFQPLTMTFHNVNYFVDMPKVHHSAVL